MEPRIESMYFLLKMGETSSQAAVLEASYAAQTEVRHRRLVLEASSGGMVDLFTIKQEPNSSNEIP